MTDPRTLDNLNKIRSFVEGYDDYFSEIQNILSFNRIATLLLIFLVLNLISFLVTIHIRNIFSLVFVVLPFCYTVYRERYALWTYFGDALLHNNILKRLDEEYKRDMDIISRDNSRNRLSTNEFTAYISTGYIMYTKIKKSFCAMFYFTELSGYAEAIFDGLIILTLLYMYHSHFLLASFCFNSLILFFIALYQTVK